MKNKAFFTVDLKTSVDDRGSIVIAEYEKHFHFEAKRIFYIYGIQQDAIRGNHANRASRFFMVCVSGSCVVEVDDGGNKEIFLLDNPGRGLFLDRMTWKIMRSFTPNCILLTLSDCLYDESEYIRDYGHFLKEVKYLNGGE